MKSISPASAQIHPLSDVHPEARLGEGVTVGPFVTIQADVVVGDRTIIYPNAVLLNGTRLGSDCEVHTGAVIGGDPQDLKFQGEYTTIEIGDRTRIREYCTLNRGTSAAGKTVIGSDCLIMAYCHVAHDCIIGNHVVLANNVNLAGHVEVGNFAIVGGLSAAHQFVRIGENVMVAGHTMLRQDVPPFVLVGREPAKVVSLNKTGLQRRNFDPERIKEIDRAYDLLYRMSLSREEAIRRIEEQLSDSPERSTLLSFLVREGRGLTRFVGQNEDHED